MIPLTVVDIECSPAAGCRNITFRDYDVAIPANQGARLICQNVSGLTGLNGPYIKNFVFKGCRGLIRVLSSAPCNATGRPA